jgi:hypothetical protein
MINQGEAASNLKSPTTEIVGCDWKWVTKTWLTGARTALSARGFAEKRRGLGGPRSRITHFQSRPKSSTTNQ